MKAEIEANLDGESRVLVQNTNEKMATETQKRKEKTHTDK